MSPRRLPRLRAPVSVELEVTNACNLSCLYCRADSGVPYVEEMDVRRWIELVDELWDLGVRRFTVSGGEPLLKKGIEELFVHLGKTGAHWSLITNGTLVTDEVALLLKEAGVGSIQITFAGFSREVDGYLRASEHAFDRSMAGVGYLRRRGLTVIPAFLLTRITVGQLDRLTGLARSLGCSEITLLNFEPYGRGARHPELALSEEDIRRADDAVNRFADLRVFRDETFHSPQSITCQAGFFAAVIDADGKVYPCVLFKGTEVHFGDVSSHPFESAWLSDRAESFRNYVRREAFCETCPHELVCTGGCRARGFLLTRSLGSVDGLCYVRGGTRDRWARED